jgi:hypothetical protein
MNRLAAIMLLLACVTPARADSGRALELDALIDLADEVVVGEVVGSSAHFERNLIVTVTRVRVGEGLKGRPPRELELVQPGGTAVHPRLGVPVIMQASSFTAMEPGEQVVLLLERRAGRRLLVGAQQGKLVVAPDEESGAPAVAVGPKRLRSMPSARGATIGARGLTLDELRERVRARSGGGAR